jgi:hypothetical protein
MRLPKSIEEKLVEFWLRQWGKRYLFGVEVSLARALLATKWDCSELMEIGYKQSGMNLPDGSFNQIAACIPLPDGTEPEIGDLGFLCARGQDPAEIKRFWKSHADGMFRCDFYGLTSHVVGVVQPGIVIEATSLTKDVRLTPVRAFMEHERFMGWGEPRVKREMALRWYSDRPPVPVPYRRTLGGWFHVFGRVGA